MLLLFLDKYRFFSKKQLNKFEHAKILQKKKEEEKIVVGKIFKVLKKLGLSC